MLQLTEQQQAAKRAIETFINEKDKTVFILKGYAGTGKTTMVKTLIPLLQSMHKIIFLMAPTGRAAKVLKEKTGCVATTIHRGIYSFKDMEVVRHDDKGDLIKTNHTKDGVVRSRGTDDLQFWFGIKKPLPDCDPSKQVFIIDESSMISSRRMQGQTLHFGTDILIDDLLTFIQPGLGGKVIFVGDPAQLPPVGDNRSVALEESYFQSRGLGVSSYQLTEILRQKGESCILKNAMMIRDLLHTAICKRNKLRFERKPGEVEDISFASVPERFCDQHPHPDLGDSVVLCYTNSMVKEYNDAIRRIYFPEQKDVVAGDILQVVRNVVNENLSLDFFNGDFVRVLNVSDKVEKISAPVWTDIAGERGRVTVSLNFRDVTLQSENGKITSCKIIDTLLNSREATLSPLQTVALYINFRMRHRELTEHEEAFNEALKNDPYFNAVQVKYGYAITGHKSQGGEWDTVYVDYSGRTGLNDDSLRWSYTATTRAENKLYGVGMPDVSPLSKLVFNPVLKINKISKEAYSYADIADMEELGPAAKPFQKQKYVCIKTQLDELGYLIAGVEARQYFDKYTIETPGGSVVVDCYYNGSGEYTYYCHHSSVPEIGKILEVVNNEKEMVYSIDYEPSSEQMLQLYNRISSLCDDMSITITNIVEHRPQYHVSYYLKTSGKSSQLQFYYKANGAFSHVIPSSVLGNEDTQLLELIDRLKG